MSESNKRLSVVIGVQSVIVEFKSRLKMFYDEYGFPQGDARLMPTDEQIEQWVKLKVDDQLNAFLQWADCPLSNARDFLRTILPWYSKSPSAALIRGQFHEYMLDDIINRHIYVPIAEGIGETWKIWSIMEMGCGDLFLEEGMDYRIHEWYRLTGREIPE